MTVKLLKWIAIGLGLVLGLVALLVVLFAVLVDEEQIKARLADTVREQTNGGTLTINGDLSLALWPRLGLRVTEISLVPAGATLPLVRVAEATAALQIRPLLRREIQVDGIRITGLELRASIDQDGRASWLINDARQTTEASGTDIAAVAAAPLAVGIRQLDIEDSLIEYHDQQTGQFVRLSELSLTASDVNTNGQDYPLRLQGVLTQSPKDAGARFTLTSELAVDITAQTLALRSTELDWQDPDMPAVRLKTAGRASLLDATAEFPAWQLAGEGLEGNGALSVNWSGEKPRFDLPLRLTRIDVPALAAASGNSLPDSFNTEVLSGLSLGVDISGSGEALAFDSLALSVGDVAVDGTISYSGADRPLVEASLHFNNLDPGVLLLPAASAPPQPDDAPAGELPLFALQLFDARLAIRADAVRYGDYQGEDMVLNSSLQQGVMRIEELSAKVYGGLVDLQATLDASALEATLAMDATVIGVDLPAVLAAAGSAQNVAGTLNASAALTAAGNSVDAWTASLSGPADFNIAAAEVREMNIEKILCGAIALTNQQALSAEFAPVTAFKTLGAKMQLERGIARLQPFSATLDNVRLGGTGQYSLADNSFDTVFTARVTGDLEARDPACRVNRRMLDIDWPVRCKGRLDEDADKWCGIDRNGLQKIIIRMATGKVQKKVEKELLKGLDKLFGGSDKKDP